MTTSKTKARSEVLGNPFETHVKSDTPNPRSMFRKPRFETYVKLLTFKPASVGDVQTSRLS